MKHKARVDYYLHHGMQTAVCAWEQFSPLLKYPYMTKQAWEAFYIDAAKAVKP